MSRQVLSDPRLRIHHADRVLLFLWPTFADGLPKRIEIRRTAARMRLKPDYIRAALDHLCACRYLRFIGSDGQRQRWYMAAPLPTSDAEPLAA